MWLSQSVFEWDAESAGGGHLTDTARATRPYEILEHATKLLQTNDAAFSRADALSNLKRAVNVRLQFIDELYGFSKTFPRCKGALERLELVGLAKPFLIRQLFELRNDVEHNDSDPPNALRLAELTDIVWYFLKATDPACRMVPDGISFKCRSGAFSRVPELGITVYLDPRNSLSANIAGWLSLAQIHETSGTDVVPLRLEECRAKPSGPDSDEPEDQIGYGLNRVRGNDERWIQGSIDIPAFLQHRLWRLALEGI